MEKKILEAGNEHFSPFYKLRKLVLVIFSCTYLYTCEMRTYCWITFHEKFYWKAEDKILRGIIHNITGNKKHSNQQESYRKMFHLEICFRLVYKNGNYFLNIFMGKCIKSYFPKRMISSHNFKFILSKLKN